MRLKGILAAALAAAAALQILPWQHAGAAAPASVHAYTDNESAELCSSENAAAYAVFGNSSEAWCSGMTAYMPSGRPEISNRYGTDGWFLEPGSYPDSYVRCDIDDDIMHGLDGSGSVAVAVRYFDGDVRGGFGLYYDSRTGPKTEFVQLEGSSQWKTKVFRLYDAYFGGGAMADDFRIITDGEGMGKSGAHVLIGGVYVYYEENDAPFEITAVSNELGNIFFEGYKIKFNIEYRNTGTVPYSFTADYTVRDYSGAEVSRQSRELYADPSVTDSLDLGTLPFGVYTLEVYVHGGGIEQRYETDLSYSRSAGGTNKNLGINVHFDDDIYTENEIRKQARLIWYAGFGSVRSSVRWSDVEQEKGVYSIPANVKAADDFLAAETDIETLAILYNQNDLYDSAPYYLQTQEQLDAFSRYCAYAAANLKADRFCILNEFNHDSSGYHNNQAEYLRIAEAAAGAVRAAREGAWINGGALAGASRYWDNLDTAAEISPELIGLCDSFSWHLYAHTSEPEDDYFSRAAALNSFVDGFGSGTEMWVTESGWPTRTANSTADEDTAQYIAETNDSATELEQARWYVRAMALNTDKARADKFFFYNLTDAGADRFDIQDNFGIIHAKGYRTPFAAKPAYVAAAAFNDITDGSAYYGNVITDGSGYGYRFQNETICLWSADGMPGGSYTYNTDHKYIVVYDMYGNPEYHEGGSYTVRYGQEPVYVTWADAVPETDLKENDVTVTAAPDTRPTPVPAPEWVPEDGALWEEDFSGAAVYDWDNANLNAMKTSGGGSYNNIFGVGIGIAEGYGRVLEQPAGSDSGFYLYNKDIFGLGRDEDIASGTLVLAQDVYIPSGAYTGGSAYIEIWGSEGLAGSTTSGRANILEITADTEAARVSFQTAAAAVDAIAAGTDNTVPLEYDMWHRLETVISYEAGTVEYYADGVRAAVYKGDPQDIMRWFPMAYFGLRSNSADAGAEPLRLLWDNICMRLAAEPFVPSMTEPAYDREYNEGTALIDMDFDSTVLPEDSTDFADFRLVHQRSAEDKSFEGDPRWTSYYTKTVSDGEGGKRLEYEHFMDWNYYYRNGLKFPFTENGTPVTADSGLLIVEFDAGIRGDTERSRVLIGLSDPNKTDSEWTPATLLSGIMPYDGGKLSVTAADTEYRNRFGNDSGMDTTMAYTGQGEMHHYKYVIDIDRGEYKMYYDGILIAELDYLAGNAGCNSFDALMITGVNAGGKTDGEAYIMIDNVCVKTAAWADGYQTDTIYLGTFDDDGNAQEKTGTASGYITTVTGPGTDGGAIESIFWRFRDKDGAVRELRPGTDPGSITLNGAGAVITVIVDGLEADTADPIAAVIN